MTNFADEPPTFKERFDALDARFDALDAEGAEFGEKLWADREEIWADVKLIKSALGILLVKAAGGQVEPSLELIEALGLKARRVVPAGGILGS